MNHYEICPVKGRWHVLLYKGNELVRTASVHGGKRSAIDNALRKTETLLDTPERLKDREILSVRFWRLVDSLLLNRPNAVSMLVEKVKLPIEAILERVESPCPHCGKKR